jgi:hypothetical protein
MYGHEFTKPTFHCGSAGAEERQSSDADLIVLSSWLVKFPTDTEFGGEREISRSALGVSPRNNAHWLHLNPSGPILDKPLR